MESVVHAPCMAGATRGTEQLVWLWRCGAHDSESFRLAVFRTPVNSGRRASTERS
jgi:hypothetical protein